MDVADGDVVPLPLHTAVAGHLQAAAEVRGTSKRVPLVDGTLFAQARQEKHLTIELAAALLGVSISRWSHIERTWGRQPLLLRLQSLDDVTAASAGTVGLKARREVLSVSLARLAATLCRPVTRVTPCWGLRC